MKFPPVLAVLAAFTLSACGQAPDDQQPAPAQRDAAPQAQPQQRTAAVEPAPATAQPAGTFQLDGDPSRGQPIYAANCASCHGTEGRGDGPAARALRPPATNFAEAEDMTAERAFIAVRDGGMAAGMAPTMPPFNRMLNEQQLHDVVAYVMQLREGAGR